MANYEEVDVRSVLCDRWLLKIEKKCFGWKYIGAETVNEKEGELETVTGLSGQITGVREKKKYAVRMSFKRLADYSSNVLFNLTEFFSDAISFIRRLALMLVGPIVAVALVIALIGLAVESLHELSSVIFIALKWIAIAYAIVVGSSLLFAGLGVLWRNVFHIDEKSQTKR